jgi:hypothetical protein
MDKIHLKPVAFLPDILFDKVSNRLLVFLGYECLIDIDTSGLIQKISVYVGPSVSTLGFSLSLEQASRAVRKKPIMAQPSVAMGNVRFIV